MMYPRLVGLLIEYNLTERIKTVNNNRRHTHRHTTSSAAADCLTLTMYFLINRSIRSSSFLSSIQTFQLRHQFTFSMGKCFPSTHLIAPKALSNIERVNN